eukprot:CAMPEP_0182928356 /NCGR_PEP_ID=MMETSP0105_2-20130417/15543_1 /TAXON_ID=81532 ORGANISM="Acanthoeca-like sp., Strain 10tr" /NCGR_SAMPLE_ID=MMETSP0105_2 /ASSEMBLY_ACC=CAM_ASM_000205 /LENGTH=593 /DNA_ID=CAMNT_0025066357 /DNA_START=429 /DNA_END=2210 /DNA_ORIENTATION=-
MDRFNHESTTVAPFIVVVCLNILSYCADAALPDCNEVAGTLSGTLAACNAMNFRLLHAAAQAQGGNAASASLCRLDCTEALRSLALHAHDCTSQQLDGFLSVASARQLLNETLLSQQACNPPSAECAAIMQRLVIFESSTTGVKCRAYIDQFSDGTQPSSVAQLENEAWCKSTCGTKMSSFLVELENAGCSTWEAFRARKVRYDPVCAQAGVPTMYCGAVFAEGRFRESIRTIRSHASGASAGTVEADDAVLREICTPCFREFVRLTYRYGISTNDTTNIDRLLAYEALCVTDGSRLCFPRYHNRTRSTAAASRTAYATALCNRTTMGRCTPKMKTREAQTASTPAAAAAAQEEALSLCATNNNGVQCAEAVASLVGGFQATIATALNTTQHALYDGPPSGKCLNVRSVEGICTWGCQTAYSAQRDNFGCCYETARASLNRLGYTGVADAFGRADTLAASCNRPADPGCPLTDRAAGVAATLEVPVPVQFFRDAPAEITAAVVSDLQRIVGTPATAIELRSFRAQTKTTSVVHFTVLAESKAASTDMVSQLAADVTQHAAAFLETSRHFTSQCRKRDGTRCGADDPILANIRK